MSDEELMEILREIANDCAERKSCDRCKFDKNSECMLKHIPSEWDIEEE